MAAEKQKQKYSYADYLGWPDEERWELIDGVAFDMSPAPFIEHQRIVVLLSKIIATYLEGKKCEVFVSPVDVYMPDRKGDLDDMIENVVQPDVIVVCDPEKIERRGIRGAPDLVIEVLSPNTSKRDWNEKFNLYEKTGVKEYWIVDPLGRVIHQYFSKSNRFELIKMHEDKSTVESPSIEGLKVELSKIFPGQ